ncbi:MAG: sigma-70 family RNA polymerase sigma factor [Bacteroidales bacterium]|nr:sigma-70 family RNA polymerase sigma factor [Bacteroidales bacterium]MBQ9186127.1 sigma-70 family RNA polymerase sigma factor [Bacteroidales bacterium]
MDLAGIVQGCKQGDSAAKEALYNLYARRLFGLCRRYVDSSEVAGDLTHDAFIIIYSSIDRLQDPSKLEPWMSSIVRNIAFDFLEKEGHLVHTDEVLDMEDVSDEPLPYPVPPFEELMKMIENLPEQYGKVFRLSVLEGLSHQEIGSILNIGEKSSSSNLFRARQLLQDIIRRYWISVPILLLLLAGGAFLLFRGRDAARDDKTVARQIPPRDTIATEEKTVVPEEITEPEAQITAPERIIKKEASPEATASVSDDYMSIEDVVQNVETADSVTTAATVATMETAETATSAQKEKECDSTSLKPVKIIQPWTPQMWEEKAPEKRRRTGIRILLAGLPGHTGTSLNATAATGYESKIESGSDNRSSWNNYYSNVGDAVDGASHESYEAILSLEKIAIVNYLANDAPYKETTYYRPAVSAGIMVNYDINGRLSLMTGARYTALSSETRMGITEANVVRTDRIKYIGVPVSLLCDIWNPGRLHLFTSGDFMAEFPVYSRWKVVHSRNYLRTYHASGSLSAPVQWSVGAGLGVQLDVSPSIGLYAEPQVRYYFNSGGSVHTVRTEYPWDVSVTLGVRLNL